MPCKVTILGSGSARPTMQNSPSGQIVELCDKSFLVDCGEGVQITMQRLGVHTSRLYNIFISHLHGDHCFGLIGLLSSLGMQHRTQPMHIYSHPDLERLMRPWLDYYCADMPYEVIFHPINPRKHEVIFEDRTVMVESVPLKHTVPCCGFFVLGTPSSDGEWRETVRHPQTLCLLLRHDVHREDCAYRRGGGYAVSRGDFLGRFGGALSRCNALHCASGGADSRKSPCRETAYWSFLCAGG